METKAKLRIMTPTETIESEIEITAANNVNSQIYEYVLSIWNAKLNYVFLFLIVKHSSMIGGTKTSFVKIKNRF